MLGNSLQDEDDLRARLRVMTSISQKLVNEKDALIETCKRLDVELNLKSKENERLKRREDVDGISTRSASEIITKLSEELKRSATEQKILAQDLERERENNLKLKRDLAQTSESFNQISSDLKKSAIEYYSIIGDYEQEMEAKVAKLKSLEMEKIHLEHDREFENIHKQHEIEKERALESLRSELQKKFDANTKELQNATKQFNDKLEAEKLQAIERLQNELELQFEGWKQENETKHQQILKEKEKELRKEKEKAIQEVKNQILPLEEEIKRLAELQKLDALEMERKMMEKDQETAKLVKVKEKLEHDLKKTTDNFTDQIMSLTEQLEKEKTKLKVDLDTQIQELQSIKPRNEVERDTSIQILKDQLKSFEEMNQELRNSLKECELQINQLKQQVLLQNDEKDDLRKERVDLLNSISLLENEIKILKSSNESQKIHFHQQIEGLKNEKQQVEQVQRSTAVPVDQITKETKLELEKGYENELKQVKEEHENYLKKILATHEQEVYKVTTLHQAQMENMRKELEDSRLLTENLNSSLKQNALIETETSRNVGNTLAVQEKELEALYQHQTNENLKRHNEEINQLKEYHSSQLSELLLHLSKNFNEESNKTKDELDKGEWTNFYQEQIKYLEGQHSIHVEEMKQSHLMEIDHLKEAYSVSLLKLENEIEEIRMTYQEESQEAREEYWLRLQETNNNLRDDFQIELERVQREYADRFVQIEEIHALEIFRLNSILTAQNEVTNRSAMLLSQEQEKAAALNETQLDYTEQRLSMHFQQRIEELRSAHLDEIQRLNLLFHNQEKTNQQHFERELESLRNEHMKENLKSQEFHSNDLSQLRLELEQEYRKQLEKSNDIHELAILEKLSNINILHSQEINSLKDIQQKLDIAHDLEVIRLNESHAESLHTVQIQYEAQLAKMDMKYIENLKRTGDDHVESQIEMKSQLESFHQSELELLKQKHNENLEQLQLVHVKEIDRLHAIFEKDRSAIEQELAEKNQFHTERQSELNTRHLSEKEEREQQFESDLERIRILHRDELERFKSIFLAEKEEMKRTKAADEKAKSDQHIIEMENLKQENQASLDQVRFEFESSHAGELRRIKEQNKALEEAHVLEILRLNSLYENQKSELQMQLENTQNIYE